MILVVTNTLFKLGLFTIKESDEVELLGKTFNKELTFRKDIQNLCYTANYKLNALRRFRNYLSLNKIKG